MQHAHSREGARPALDTCRVLVQMVSKACPYFAQRNSHPPPVASRSAPRLAAITHTGFPSTQPSLPPLLKLTHTAGFEATLQYTKQPPGTSKHWGGAQLHGQPHERLQQYFTMTPPPSSEIVGHSSQETIFSFPEYEVALRCYRCGCRCSPVRSGTSVLSSSVASPIRLLATSVRSRNKDAP